VRTQQIHVVGEEISVKGIPAGWRHPEILHAGPVFNEIGLNTLSWFEPEIRAATLQGWIRAANNEGVVRPFLNPNLPELAALLDVAIYSNQDLSNDIRLQDIVRDISIRIETMGSKGCRVIEKHRVFEVPTSPVTLADPTGAGDIFATAFLTRYRESGNPVDAAGFANAFAAEMLAFPDFRRDLETDETTADH
jgi:sugar/nucleoside kinase (ribokinase family)